MSAPERPDRAGITERLQDYLDGRLSADDAREVESQIASDDAWRDECEHLRALGDVVRAAMPDGEQTAAPADFVQQVRARIEDQRVANERAAAARGRWGRILTVSYAAAALVLVGFTVVWMVNERSTPPPDEQTADEPKPPKLHTLEGSTQMARRQAPTPSAATPSEADALKESAKEKVGGADTPRDRETAARPRKDPAREDPAARAKLDKKELGSRAGRRGARPAVGGKAEARTEAKAGPFRQPGGGVPPNLRAPSDEAPPAAPAAPAAPGEPTSKAAPVALSVFVYAESATAARTQVRTLLSLAEVSEAGDETLQRRLDAIQRLVHRAPAKAGADDEAPDLFDEDEAESGADKSVDNEVRKAESQKKKRRRSKDSGDARDRSRGRVGGGAPPPPGAPAPTSPAPPQPTTEMRVDADALQRLVAAFRLKRAGLSFDQGGAAPGQAKGPKKKAAPVRIRVVVVPPK